jgi:hypothetical protein
MAVAGSDRITVDALGRNALAAAALDRVVQAQHHRPGRSEDADQQAQQQAGGVAGGPGGAVEHPVVVGETPLPREPDDTQQARHRALAGGQDGAEQQHFGVAPSPVAEERRRIE